MKLEDLHIGVSPLTETIYIGTVNKKTPGVWGTKVECTSKFIAAVMDWIPPGTIRLIRDNKGNEYEIEVRIIRKEPV